MKCHKYVTSSFDLLQQEITKADADKRKPENVVSPDLQKLYDALGMKHPLNSTADPHAAPISWVRVHNLPEYVSFDHSAHVTAGVSCQ